MTKSNIGGDYRIIRLNLAAQRRNKAHESRMLSFKLLNEMLAKNII